MGRRAFVFAAILLAACTARERPSPSRDAAALPGVSSLASPASAELPVAPLASSRPTRALPVIEAPAIPAIPISAWVWKTYRGGKFSILFPGEPKISELPAEDDKVGYTEALLEMPGGQVSFVAGFTEHSQEEVSKPETFLDDRANTPRRGLTDVLHQRSITLAGGHPGRVLILRRNLSGTPLRVYSRLYLVGRRLYSLIVSTLDVGGVSEDVVKKFMDSFALR